MGTSPVLDLSLGGHGLLAGEVPGARVSSVWETGGKKGNGRSKWSRWWTDWTTRSLLTSYRASVNFDLESWRLIFCCQAAMLLAEENLCKEKVQECPTQGGPVTMVQQDVLLENLMQLSCYLPPIVLCLCRMMVVSFWINLAMLFFSYLLRALASSFFNSNLLRCIKAHMDKYDSHNV